MKTYKLHREIFVPRPLAEVFEFFARPENLEALTPPWVGFRILTPPPISMEKGATIEYKIKVRGLPLHWLTVIERWNPPFEFVDVQAKGPYRLWRHTHSFVARDDGTSIVDNVEYALPFGWLGELVNRFQVAKDVTRIFEYRAERVREMFA